ncbi:hypothetical protein EAE96_001766 [Botrytis aclada]|nr:hypothetical protein EAE96_001766 [Botrytis aclada]
MERENLLDSSDKASCSDKEAAPGLAESQQHKTSRFQKKCGGRNAVFRRVLPWVLHLALLSTSLGLLIKTLLMQRSLPATCVEDKPQWTITMDSVPDTHHFERLVGSFNRSSSPYKGPPSPAVDATWADLTDYGAISISEETFGKLNASKNAVKVPAEYGGGRLAFVEAIHQLHCFESLWRHTYPDYYREAARKIKANDQEWHDHMAMVLIVPLENLNALAWTLFSISTVLTLGRFYIRWQKGKSLHLDDIFNALALGSLLAFAITYQVYLPIQYNYQLYTLGLGGYLPSDDQLMYAQNVGIVNIVFFWVTIYLVKASFLALYWALFSVSIAFRRWWLAVAIYTGISFLATFFAIFWSCKTPSQLEDLEACNTISEELIIGLETLWCVLNTVGDIMTMLLPLGMLRAMHMPTSR